MRTRYVLLFILTTFILTRKKYYLKNFNFLIPNTAFIGQKNNETTLNIIKNNVIINFKNGSWIVSIKPIYGFKIPYTAILPITGPLAIPQILAQIGNNITLTDDYKFGILIGKRLIIKGVTFYA